MTSAEKAKIKDLSKCDFKAMAEYYKAETEKRKARSKEEKKAETEVKKKEAAEYGVAYVDGHKQAIGNFRIEPPGIINKIIATLSPQPQSSIQELLYKFIYRSFPGARRSSKNGLFKKTHHAGRRDY